MLEAELARALGERRREEREHPGARLDELRCERHDLARPGLERRGVGDARSDAAERRVALPERGRVRRREVGRGRAARATSTRSK